MGFSAQPGHVGFKTQSVKGTYADPGSGGVFMRTTQGALAGTRTLMIPNPEIGGGRDISDALLGPVAFEGTYNFYARMDSLATLLQGGLGTAADSHVGTTPGTDLVGTHVITPTDGALPWLSVEEQIGNDFEHFRYTDVKVNTLHLEAAADGYLMGTVGMIGLQGTTVPGASMTAVPAWDSSPLMVGTNVTVSFGGNVLPGKAFTFDLNNNLENNDFRLGSLFLGDAIEKQRQFNATITQRPNDSSMWKQAVYGDPNATHAQGTVVKSNVSINCLTYEFIGNTVTVYSLTITAPKVAIEPFALAPTGQDAIQYDVTLDFLRPNPNVPICTVTVVNGRAVVA